MALPVVTVASGGLPVVDVTSTRPNVGLPVSEAANGRGIPVSKIGVSASKGALAVVYVASAGGSAVPITPSNMTADNAPAPYVASASSVFFEPYKGFDGTPNLYWASASAPPAWLKIDLGSAKAGSSYKLTAANPASHQPTAWTLEGSLNDSTWTTVDTRSGIPVVGSGVSIGTFTMATPGTYRYWRLTGTASASGTNVEVGEWVIYA